jgi:hypothetical protein
MSIVPSESGVLMTIQMSTRDRPGVEDYLRAIAYLALSAWSVLFYIFPPQAFVSELDGRTRMIWLGFSLVGSLMAFAGAVSHIDLKLELPGILLSFVGPIFYGFSQFYLVMYPTAESGPPTARIALVVFASVPVFLQLPRVVSLFIESRRLKRINQVRTGSIPLTAAEEQQPGAFASLRKVTSHRKGR